MRLTTRRRCCRPSGLEMVFLHKAINGEAAISLELAGGKTVTRASSLQVLGSFISHWTKAVFSPRVCVCV